MCKKPTVMSPVGIVVIAAMLNTGCNQSNPVGETDHLDIKYTGADSPNEIELRIRQGLAAKFRYPGYGTVDSAYTLYDVTNGPSRFLFAAVGNAPRGVDMFNLYCYEQESQSNWLLRAYIPVNAYYYPDSPGSPYNADYQLRFLVESEYVKVVFRGNVVFTITTNKFELAIPTMIESVP
jgi:hypothetical protein